LNGIAKAVAGSTTRVTAGFSFLPRRAWDQDHGDTVSVVAFYAFETALSRPLGWGEVQASFVPFPAFGAMTEGVQAQAPQLSGD